jgi:predicted SnoaL-like aldol condensation-catalyzing enzyme
VTDKEIVRAAIDGVYNARNPEVVDRFFNASLGQHGSHAEDGQQGLRRFISGLDGSSSCDVCRVFGEDDLIVTHGIYRHVLEQPQVGFELWRLQDGLIVEHWDGFEPLVTATASGHSQTDGPVTANPDAPAGTKALVEEIVQTILVDNDFSALDRYLAGDDYIQHNPRFGDGVSGLAAALESLAEQGITMTYSSRHQTVAEGDFAFTLSEGRFGGTPYAFYDLFRITNGRAIEHWDVITPEPESLPHANGLY